MDSHLVTEADHEKTIDVRKGDSITIHLPESPTTGYRWSLDQQDPATLEPIEKPLFESGSTALGAGGGRKFTFLAKASGESCLSLNLRRSWETEKSPRKQFRVRVHIHE
jgi:inhibitor of cysteine peptidase